MPAYCKAPKMITLTTPNGEKIHVAVDSITVMAPNHGDYHAAAKSVLVIGGNTRAVRESIEEIEKLLAE